MSRVTPALSRFLTHPASAAEKTGWTMRTVCKVIRSPWKIGTDGRSWLIDPAAHGGHREFDLAMMRLFGGFGEACFAAYAEAAPLSDGWQERVALHQLAPLVVHAIKFGGGYVAATLDALDAMR